MRNAGFWMRCTGRTRRIFWLTGSRCERKGIRVTPKYKRTMYHLSTEGKPGGAARGGGGVGGREQGPGLGMFSWKAHKIPVQGRGEAGGCGEPSKFLESEGHKKASAGRARGAPVMPGQKNKKIQPRRLGEYWLVREETHKK